jgi:hypothetical protein
VRKFFLVLSLAGISSACQPTSVELSAQNVQGLVSKIVYVQDTRTQICYAIAGYNRPGEIQYDLSIASVDCDKVKDYLSR